MELSFDFVGKLLPNLWTMLVQLMSTGVLLYFVKKWLWFPAREYLDKRAEYAQLQIAQAEELRHEANTLSSSASTALREAGAQARELIDKAKNDSVVLKESMLKQAKQEADSKLTTAQKEIEFQRRAMQEEVTQEIVLVAMAATEKLLVDRTSDEEDRKAIEKFVKDVSAK